MIDFEQEVKELQERPEWFRPGVGTYQCQILEEPEFVLRTFKEGEEAQKMLKVLLLANGKKYSWDVGMGQTLSSMYGQLMFLGKSHGKLKDVNFTLAVKSNTGKDGKHKNEYTILEVLQAQQQKV